LRSAELASHHRTHDHVGRYVAAHDEGPPEVRRTTLTRATRQPDDHFVFCFEPGSEPFAHELGRITFRRSQRRIEWPSRGVREAMAFESHQGSWRVIECRFCGAFNGSI